MSDDNKKIIYILIGSGRKPLAGYGQYQGEFIQVCEDQLGRCKSNQSACINTGDYKIFYMNENNVTYLLMTMPIYPLSAAVACIESLKKELADELGKINFNDVGDYGLNNKLKEKLRLKLEYYNENTDIVSDSLQNLKNKMMEYKDEVLKAAESLNERGEYLNEMQNKASDLENNSFKYREHAEDVRRKECRKKACTIGIICGVVGAIILIVVLCVCL